MLCGCPHQGVVDDGTSVSYGPSNGGKLIKPHRLPRAGTGFRIPKKWSDRGLNYGTDEMVRLIVYMGRRMDARHPGARLGVADISLRRGGPSAWHRSHQTGRDVDFLFFTRDMAGRPVRLDRMAHFGPTMVSRPATGPDGVALPRVKIDLARTWHLVRVAIENPVTDVQWIFMYDAIKQRLLDWARAHGEPEDIIAEAGHILRQPSDSALHDDHMHMRIYCAQSDRVIGCVDRGTLRWTKKYTKYGARWMAAQGVPRHVRRAVLAPVPAMLVLGLWLLG